VITLAGEPDAVAEAALRGVGRALELIDLTKHSGAHPRVGATDVVPFIPVDGATIEDCAALARRVGREIWERYKIPVYFYEAAALRPQNANLENVRKGQFEGLREEAQRNPERAPDVGGPALHPTAGATVVGARKFLIAYNINLNTSDISIANKIAKAIRFSSGGLRYAKAMGVDLRARGLAQVSVNMTDYEQTPLHRVFEMVEREAKRYGVMPVGSEIVGLVPQKALDMAADYYLQLENFSAAQVLENRLAAAREGRPLEAHGGLAAMARPLLEAVAAPTAAPGGGSVAALAGALGACLGQMVAQISRQKKSQAQFAEQLSNALAELRRAADALAHAIDEDAAAYEGVMTAMKLLKGTPEEQQKRAEAIQQATRGAAEVPLRVAEAGAELLDQLGQLEPLISPSMISDLRVGRLMAAAAVRGALENVAINLDSISDAAYVKAMRARAAALEERLAAAKVAVG